MKLSTGNNFTGISHGIEFVNGISNEIHDFGLYSRMVLKGYQPVEEETEEKPKRGKKKSEDEVRV